MNNLMMKIETGAPVYVFTFQARNDGEDVAPELTQAQIEAARNAAASVLELVGATVDSTGSILTVESPSEPSKLVLTPSIVTASEIARVNADAQAQAAADAATLEAARAQARAEAETRVVEEPVEEIVDEPIEDEESTEIETEN